MDKLRLEILNNAIKRTTTLISKIELESEMAREIRKYHKDAMEYMVDGYNCNTVNIESPESGHNPAFSFEPGENTYFVVFEIKSYVPFTCIIMADDVKHIKRILGDMIQWYEDLRSIGYGNQYSNWEQLEDMKAVLENKKGKLIIKEICTGKPDFLIQCQWASNSNLI